MRSTVMVIGLTILGCLFLLMCKSTDEPPACREDGPDIFGVYSENFEGVRLDVNGLLGIDFGGGGQFVPNPDSGFVDVTDEVREGAVSKRATINVGPNGQWAIWFVQHSLTSSNSETKNMCDYENGRLQFWVKAESAIRDLLVGIRSGNVRPGEETSKVLLSRYPAFKADNQWHEITIPLSDFSGEAPDADLTQIKIFFVIGSSSGDTGGTNGTATFWVDNVRWVK